MQAAQDSKANPHYIVLVGMTEKWQMVPRGNPLTRMTEKAILEKENLIIGAPEGADDTEKR